MSFPVTGWRWAHLVLAMVAMVGVAGYWVAKFYPRPFDTATAAEPRVPANPSPTSPVTQAQFAPATTQPIPVVKPQTQSVSSYVEVTGNAASVNAVKLIARVEGYLDQIHYEDGQFVKKGDLLFTVQQDQYKDQLQQAQAQVLTAQASLTYAKTEFVRGTRSWSSRMRQPRPRSTTGLSSGRVRRRRCSTLRRKWHSPS